MEHSRSWPSWHYFLLVICKIGIKDNKHPTVTRTNHLFICYRSKMLYSGQNPVQRAISYKSIKKYSTIRRMDYRNVQCRSFMKTQNGNFNIRYVWSEWMIMIYDFFFKAKTAKSSLHFKYWIYVRTNNTGSNLLKITNLFVFLLKKIG